MEILQRNDNGIIIAGTGINGKYFGWCLCYGAENWYNININKIERGEDMNSNKRDIILRFSQQVKLILGDKLDKVILYGSYARGDYNEHSDVDIMILTTLTDEEIEEVETEIFDLAFDFQMDYDIDISVVIQNKERFNYWLGALPFYNNVQKEGIVLNG